MMKRIWGTMLVILFLGTASSSLAKRVKHPKPDPGLPSGGQGKAGAKQLTSPTASQVNGVSGVRGLELQKPQKKRTWINKKPVC